MRKLPFQKLSRHWQQMFDYNYALMPAACHNFISNLHKSLEVRRKESFFALCLLKVFAIIGCFAAASFLNDIFSGCHDIQHDDIQHNDTQHNAN